METKVQKCRGGNKIVFFILILLFFCFSSLNKKQTLLYFEINYVEINYYNESVWFPEYQDLDSINFSIKYQIEIFTHDKKVDVDKELKKLKFIAIYKDSLYYPLSIQFDKYGILSCGDPSKKLWLKFDFPSTYKLSEIVDNQKSIAYDIYTNFSLICLYSGKIILVKKSNDSGYIVTQIIKEK